MRAALARLHGVQTFPWPGNGFVSLECTNGLASVALPGTGPRYVLIHPKTAGPEVEQQLRRDIPSLDLGGFQMIQ